MNTQPYSCAFTGHRAEKLPWRYDESHPACLDLKKRLHDAVFSLYDAGIRKFFCGMASGCDLYFCEEVLTLRQEHPEVVVEAVIPCEQQAARWPAEQKRRYDKMVSACDYQTLVQTSYTPDCMMRRNRYMIDHADVLLCAYDGKPGGTQATMLYAMRQGLQLIELPVDTSQAYKGY